MKKTALFIGSVFVLILSAIVFIFVPAMAGGVAEQNYVFGKYGNKKIEYKPGTEFAQAVSNYTEMFKQQYGDINNDYAYYIIYSNAFNSAVHAIAYSDAVKNSGYEPAESAVTRTMLNQFLDENGKFSKDLFESYPDDVKVSLKKDITNGFIWNRYSEDLLGSQSKVHGHTLFGLKTADNETAFLKDMAEKQTSFEVAVFDKAKYPDSAVKSFAADNAAKFDRYNLSVITVKNKSDAKKILKEVKAGSSFADAVSTKSDKAYSGSDGIVTSNLGYQIAGIIKNAEDTDKVFNLNTEEISDVIETTTGFSIFRCNLPKVAANIEDPLTIKLVRSYIEENEASRIEDFFITSAKGLTANAPTKSFAQACKDSEAEHVVTKAFPLNWSNSSFFDSLPTDVTGLAGADTNENFLTKAFALKDAEISEPVVLGNYVLVLKKAESKTVATDAEKITTAAANADSTDSQNALLTSSKVVNNVQDVFFNQMMNK